MIRILCVGKLKAAHYRAAADDYLRRLRRFAKVEIVEIPDSTPAREAQQLSSQLGGARLLACDVEGDLLSSEELSEELGRHGSLDFLLGGPEGIDAPLLSRADRRIAFGRMTLPHELARVLLLEQLYRGFTLLRGHPYHR